MVYPRTAFVSVEYGIGIRIENCSMSNSNSRGVVLNGASSAVSGCSLTNMGCAAISIQGGDSVSLVPSNNVISDNVITYFALLGRTYNPGVAFTGVGHRVSHNFVGYAPHTAMLGYANDCLFEYNTIRKVGVETSDLGAWYSGRTWTQRGNVLRHNLFEDVLSYLPNPIVTAVYLDDMISGHVVQDNVFLNCYNGVYLGGGRFNVVTGNFFYNISSVAVHFDNRGAYYSQYCAPGGIFNAQLDAVNYEQPPFSTHYPDIASTCETTFSLSLLLHTSHSHSHRPL